MKNLLKTLKGMQYAIVDDNETGGPSGPEPAGETGVTDDNTDYDAEVTKRGARSVIEENRAKAKELKALKAELEEFKKPKPQPQQQQEAPKGKKYERIPHLKAFVDKYKGGVTADKITEYLEDIAELTLETASGAAQFHSGEVMKKFEDMTELQQEYQERRLGKTLDELAQEPKYKFLVTKYRDEIIETTKKDIKDPKFWKNKSVIEAMAGKVIMSHVDDLETTTAAPVKEKVNETDNTSSARAGSSGSVSQEEMEEAAGLGDFDLSTAQGKKMAIESARARKKRDELFSKLQNQ